MKKDKFSLMPRSAKAVGKPYRNILAPTQGRKPAFLDSRRDAEERMAVALAGRPS